MIEVWRKANDKLAIPAKRLKGGFTTMREAESFALTLTSQEAIDGHMKCYAAAAARGRSQIEFRGQETPSEGA
jgi:hypothetical protein